MLDYTVVKHVEKGQKGMNIHVTWYIKKSFLHQWFKLINLGSNPHVYSNQRKQDGDIYTVNID